MRKLLTLAAFTLSIATASPALADETSREATLYKTPQCGCCETYADYLRENGFAVRVTPTHDLVSISREAGIPEDLLGCHTMFIDDYVVSGHVPVSTIDRLLSERPAIRGVTLPGMPMGSPGMSGVQTEPFTIYEIGDGAPRIYAVE